MINIVFYSSLSSKMGAELALINNSNKGDINIFIRLWSFDNGLTIFSYLTNRRVELLLRSKYIKWLLPKILMLLALFIPWTKIYMPRPNWIGSNIFDYFISEKIVYYGDGFSLLCMTPKPFWLSNFRIQPKPYKSKFIYSYSLDDSISVKDNLVKVDKKIVLDYVNSISYAPNKLINSLNLCGEDRLLIIPITTFFKTKRMSLMSELELYLIAINFALEKHPCNKILIKFHPSVSADIIEKYVDYFKDKIKLIKLDTETNLLLAHFPIELLLRDLKNSYSLVITSSGVAFAATLLSVNSVIFSFGEDLLKNYLNDDFLKSRIHQEYLMERLFHAGL